MKIGVIGTGRIGVMHARHLRMTAGVSTVLLHDLAPGAASRAAARLGGGYEVCDDLVAMLEQCDGVVVATNTSSHPAVLRRAVESRTPVLCEKPIASDLNTMRELVTFIEASGEIVVVGFQRRFDDGYRTARQALLDGKIGDLHRAHVVTGDQEPPHADYIPKSGGFFRDCSIHDFDILRWVTGREVVDVMTFGSNRGADFFREAGDVDNAAGVLRLDDDTLVTLQGSRYNGGGHDVRMELAGTKGTYVVGLNDRSPLTSAEENVDFPGGEPWPNFWVRFTPAYVAEINAFVDMANGEAPSPCSVEEALAALHIAEAADISMREGRRVGVAEVRK